VDGQFLYEINKQALVAQTNGSGELPQRSHHCTCQHSHTLRASSSKPHCS
jgi:hypothetical protein